jgi:hypothetical protein
MAFASVVIRLIVGICSLPLPLTNFVPKLQKTNDRDDSSDHNTEAFSDGL